MREIKFRAWYKPENKMFEVSSISGLDSKPIVYLKRSDTIGFWTEPDEFELMQYTGLKDKNEKEICEGDIVRFDNNTPNDFFDYVVDDLILGDFIYINYHEMGHYYLEENGEVVGNAYENPVLLKGEQR